MSSVWIFLLAVILLTIWIITGGYVTQANVYLTPYKKDPDLSQAYGDTFWAAFITWLIVGIFVLLVILAIVGIVALFGTGVGEVGVAAEAGGVAEESSAVSEVQSKPGFNYNQYKPGARTISWTSFIFLLGAIILVGVTGIYAAAAARHIAASSMYNPNNYKMKKAYDNCIKAAVLSLGSVGLLIIVTIGYFIYQYVQRRRAAEAVAAAKPHAE